jgi:transposase
MSILPPAPAPARGPLSPAAPPPPPPGRFREPPWHPQTPQWQDLDQRLPPDHPARQIARAVASLDLRPLLASYGGTGAPPYPPELLLRVVLYERHLGRNQPAAWARDARENDPVRWLAQGCTPSRARWYAFRDRLQPFLPDWNRHVLRRAQAQGLTAGQRASVDGSAVAALASRHRLVNEATLEHRLQQLDARVAADSGQPPPAVAADPAADPAAAGSAAAAPPAWMARQPAGRLRQRDRYRQARRRLAELQAHNQQRRREDRKPRDKVRVSLGDPEAALGLDKLKVYRPLYDVQLVTDLDSPLVLAYQVFAQPTDAGLLGPMLGRLTFFLGHQVHDLLADAGYATGAQLALAERAQVTLYAPWQANEATAARRAQQPAPQIPKSAFTWRVELQTYACPAGHLLEYAGTSTYQRSGTKYRRTQYRCPPEHCSACPQRQACTRRPEAGRTVSRHEYEEEIERLRQRMATPAAQALYRLRKQTVERGFADVKEHRQLRRFSGRGLARAQAEVGLAVLVHNLLAVQRLQPRDPAPQVTLE